MTILSVLAILALPVGFLSGGVTIYAAKDRDWSTAWKAGVVFLICAFLYVAAPKSTISGGDCYTDWDGRSNATVCD